MSVRPALLAYDTAQYNESVSADRITLTTNLQDLDTRSVNATLMRLVSHDAASTSAFVRSLVRRMSAMLSAEVVPCGSG